MKLRLLHILCEDEASVQKVEKRLSTSDCILEQWKQANDGEGFTLQVIVDKQDQELFDDLESIAEERDKVRLSILPIEATFPNDSEEEVKEEKENKASFFDIISREEMRAQVRQISRFNGSYLSLVVLSAIVATIALVEGNIAILIGAMVLTPLLGPNLALPFAVATSDKKLTKVALLSGLGGINLSFVTALIVGYLMGDKAEQGMVQNLVEFGFESVPVAICAGIAATVLLLQGTVSTLIGVMVAVAFLPPLAMSGLALSAGEIGHSLNAALLFAINLASFNLASQSVLLIVGLRPHRSDDDEENSLRKTLIYITGWTLAISLLCVGLYFK